MDGIEGTNVSADRTAVFDWPDTRDGSSAAAMIERIAGALGIPAEALARSAISHGEQARLYAQNAEAAAIFAGITDTKAREQALAYLRWIADQTGPR